jgi:ATP-dependent RNA helicase RhlE
MLDMGFKRDIDKIMSLIPSRRQNLLFSATFSKEIKFLARDILNNPETVETSPQNTTVEAIVQKAYKVDKNKKPELIIKLIKEGGWSQVLVFTRTKHGANNLCKKMVKSDIQAAAIHGNKSQSARTKALFGFKNGTVEVLVATDIAARGLDIPLLPHVINFELPNIPEDYVHRIGRTGRAGAKGEALSLVSGDENIYLRDIEKLIGSRIQISTVEGFEPDPNFVPVENNQRTRTKHKPRNPNKGYPRRRNRS